MNRYDLKTPPNVATAKELIDRAFKKASSIDTSQVKVGKGPKRDKKLAIAKAVSTAKISSVKDYLTTRLRAYVKGYPSFDGIPEFYRELIDTNFDMNDIKKTLASVDNAGKKIKDLSINSIRRINRCQDSIQPNKIRNEFYGRTASIIKQISPGLDILIQVRTVIKQLPAIDPEKATVVIAGAPNVGKSSLVSALSTAKPKSAVYPFTTKHISIGIMEFKNTKVQILDTPGLLDRGADEMNNIEKRAAAALEHIATVIVFLIDPTGYSGYELDMQTTLGKHIKERFSTRVPVLFYYMKSDLYDDRIRNLLPGDTKELSATTGEGVEVLKHELEEILTEK